MCISRMSPIHFKRSKFNLIFMFVGSLAFVGLGFFIIIAASADSAHWLKWLLGVPTILFFGWTAGTSIQMFYSDVSGLVVSELGIEDSSSKVRLGMVPWSAVAAIEVTSVHQQKFISILLHEPEKFVQDLCGISKFIARMNMHFYQTPFHITSNGLVASHDEVHKAVVDYYESYNTAKK